MEKVQRPEASCWLSRGNERSVCSWRQEFESSSRLLTLCSNKNGNATRAVRKIKQHRWHLCSSLNWNLQSTCVLLFWHCTHCVVKQGTQIIMFLLRDAYKKNNAKYICVTVIASYGCISVHILFSAGLLVSHFVALILQGWGGLWVRQGKQPAIYLSTAP